MSQRSPSQQRRILEQLMRGFHTDLDIVLSLHDIQGLDLGVIARALHIPESTARMRLRTARGQLAEALRQREARRLAWEDPIVLPALFEAQRVFVPTWLDVSRLMFGSAVGQGRKERRSAQGRAAGRKTNVW